MNIFKGATTALFFSLFVAQGALCMDSDIANFRDMHKFIQDRDKRIADNRINDIGWNRLFKKIEFDRCKKMSTAVYKLSKKRMDNFLSSIKEYKFGFDPSKMEASQKNLDNLKRNGQRFKNSLGGDSFVLRGNEASIRYILYKAEVYKNTSLNKYQNQNYKENEKEVEKRHSDKKVRFKETVDVLILPDNEKTTEFLREGKFAIPRIECSYY